MNSDVVVSVKSIKIFFYTDQRCNKAVNGVSFDIKKGKTLCIVGESGCGKSTTALSIMRLLPELSRIEEGEIIFNSEDGPVAIQELTKNGKAMRKIRGSEIAMVFQDPMTSLNPVFTVGFQIMENLLNHNNMSKREARKETIGLLKKMGISLPEERIDEYPHQYSGGMRQRAMIAMAMSCNPKVLIADEPTTSLDVTIQAQIFELMDRLKKEYETAIVLITHDMGVVAELADDIAVMYMGNIIESGTLKEVLSNPTHPYTKALLESIPVLGKGKNQKLEPIRGTTPDPFNRPKGCQFEPRCDYAYEKCKDMPADELLGGEHVVKCWKSQEVLKDAKK